jgi:hypothetical protein
MFSESHITQRHMHRALAMSFLMFTGTLVAQEPAPRKLTRIASFEADFASISRIRELPDGRILVSDPKEPTLYLIDLVARNRIRLGRQGAGPGEYIGPWWLILLAQADSTFIRDRGGAGHSALAYIARRFRPAGSSNRDLIRN